MITCSQACFFDPYLLIEPYFDQQIPELATLSLIQNIPLESNFSDLFRLNLTIRNEDHIAIVDTWASKNFVRESFLEKLIVENKDLSIKIFPRSIFVRVGNLETIECNKTIQLSFNIFDKSYEDTFVIFPNLSQEIIIGLPFLRKTNTEILFSHNLLRIRNIDERNNNHLVRIQKAESLNLALSLTDELHLPGYHKTLV